jgi:hypothetical protein
MLFATAAPSYAFVVRGMRTDDNGEASAPGIISPKLETKRFLNFEKLATHLERRFGFYARRLTNIADRIQSRIDKVKATGKDTTAAQAKLDSARQALTQATTDGQAAIAALRAITPAPWAQQKDAFMAAKDLAKKARQEFVDARKLMVQAVQLLAQLQGKTEASPEASESGK